MPKRPVKAQASSTRAFGSGFAPNPGSFTFSSNASSLSYVWEAPDLTSISDPNLTVSFKNLSKKDSTTKAKGLEEIQTYVASSQEVDDAILEAWVQFYPRLSIDGARRVRQLAHNVQGRVSVACGKRIAKYMPQIAGAWLAGTFDNDRAVAKAAQEALRQLFSSPEKLKGVRIAYQSSLLEFCRNSIDNETPQTLSDERSSSPDEVEAKYNRLVASVILLLTSLLQELAAEEIQKQEAVYAEMLQDDQLWKLSYHAEPSVRRAVHRLLRVCIARHASLVQPALPSIGAAYIGHGLRSDQTGSSLDFIEALNALIGLGTSTWTENAKGSKSVSRLCSLLKRGSQLGPSDYWPNAVSLVQKLPREAYAANISEARDVLDAIATGARRKDEPRTNLPAAWRAYVHLTVLLIDGLTFEDTNELIRSHVVPIFDQYIRPTEQTIHWELHEQASSSVLDQFLEEVAVRAAITDKWQQITHQLVQDMQTSLPEQAKDFRVSQDKIAKSSKRWAAIHSSLSRYTEHDSTDIAHLLQAAAEVTNSATDLLQRRTGKPYGAAAALAVALYTLDMDSAALQQTEDFVQAKLPHLFCSPSASFLADVLYFFHDRTWFKATWEATLQIILDQQPDLLQALLSSQHVPPDFELTASSPALRTYIDNRTQRALDGQSDWSFLNSLKSKKSSQLGDAVVNDALFTKLMESLTLDEKAPRALDGLHTLMRTDRAMVENYLQKPQASQLLPRLLYLSESADEDVSQSALNFNKLVQKGFMQTKDSTSSRETLFKTIQTGLFETSDTSVSTEALIKLSEEFLNQHASALEESAGLLPTTDDWDKSLKPLLELSPSPALAISSPLGAALHLVEATSTSRAAVLSLPRDPEGQCAALRAIRYVTALLQKVPINSLPAAQGSEVARLFCLSLVLANENLSVSGANHLWLHDVPEVEAEMVELVSNMQGIFKSWIGTSQHQRVQQNSSEDPENFIESVLERLWIDSKGRSPRARYNAEAYAMLLAEFSEIHGSQLKSTESLAMQAAELRKDGGIIQLAALLYSRSTELCQTVVGSRWRSELVADLTGVELTIKPDEVLYKLTLLNLLFTTLPNGAREVAKQRTMFFMRHILLWLQSSPSDATRAQIFHSLIYVLPNITDLYGEHWSQMLIAITACWSSAPRLDPAHPETHTCLPAIHFALRLYGVVVSASRADGEESCEDLVDALKDAQQNVVDALFNLFTLAQDCPDEHNQPLRMINELAARHIAQAPVALYPEPETLYSLLSSPSEAVLQAVYESLHKRIPVMQEQISLDAALEKRAVKLPEELLSLLLKAPTTSDLEDALWERGTPIALKGYLLCWLLVFDHFSHASYKVKSDYLDSLKEVSLLPALMDFTFSFLGHKRGKPVDASRFDITNYSPFDSSGDARKDCQQLLCHVYFLALQYVPSLVKAWWIDLRARALVLTVESWTEKYVSPHIISSALDAVSRWAAEQDDPNNANAASEGERLKVSVSQRASEIRASYDVDEQTMSITIKLPGAWPLLQASVLGTSRVGVDERKWQSWVRGCQGVITFSNNNIIDGLLAFRRNVVGAMKGQTECAICYSVISSDKQLPSKRCGTCKNLFHSGCLYRWFKTSNASTCPLCRNPFNYG